MFMMVCFNLGSSFLSFVCISLHVTWIGTIGSSAKSSNQGEEELGGVWLTHRVRVLQDLRFVCVCVCIWCKWDT